MHEKMLGPDSASLISYNECIRRRSERSTHNEDVPAENPLVAGVIAYS